ncbi:hypothetical protein RNJ44_02511 [Nakaseomyces bracarensis]|uniref:Uncharacterized protein n=1 Tax=Nakaseomyces bracarensis TaxID=273131 RepID=A0ABR4NLX1_9SACH
MAKLLLWQIVYLLLAYTTYVNAYSVDIDEDWPRACSGIYSRKESGSSQDPVIRFNLKNMYSLNQSPSVAVAIFNVEDIELIGHTGEDEKRIYVCDSLAIQKGYCTTENVNKIIVQDSIQNSKGQESQLSHKVMSFTQANIGQHIVDYQILDTGYYCALAVSTISESGFEATIEFRSSTGNLKDSSYRKISYFGWLSVCYLLASLIYNRALIKNRGNNLKIQSLLGYFGWFSTLVFLVIWHYYTMVNKLDFTFITTTYGFLLCLLGGLYTGCVVIGTLLIAFGYKLVFPNLKTEEQRLIYGIAWFFFLFSPVTYVAKFFGIKFPLCILLIVSISFLLLVNKCLYNTTGYLRTRSDERKVYIYRRLQFIVYALFAYTVFLVVYSFRVALTRSLLTPTKQWQWQHAEVVIDVMPSVIFYICYICLLYLFRPLSDSYSLVVSSGMDVLDESVVYNENTADGSHKK